MLKRLSLVLFMAAGVLLADTLPAHPTAVPAEEAAVANTINEDTTPVALPAKSERVVQSVEVRYKGPAAVSEQVARSHIELKAGDKFTQSALDRSIKALFETGLFENVYATPLENEPGKITVSFELTAKLRVRTLNFEGNNGLKTKKLLKESGLKSNQTLGAENLSDAVRKLKAYYGKKNYPDVKIVTRTTPLESAGLCDVTFVIDEGRKVKIKEVYFLGNDHVKAAALKKVMATKRSSMWSFFTGSGKVEDERLTDDLQLIGDYYRNMGYLEVKVTGPQTTPYGDGVTLTYTIVEGKRFYVGEQTLEGNTLYTNAQLAKAFVLKKGQPLSSEAVEQTSHNIRDIYGSKGYLETVVKGEMLPSSNAAVLDVKYSVKESKQYSVGTINIEGNTTTRNIVVARELLLAPGDTFSATKMKTSQSRLQNTGYFDKVNLTDEPSTTSSTSDSQRDLNVSVTEGKTGNVTFGAGFGSLDHAMVFGEFNQGNFDIMNPSNGFRGAGQKLRLYASLGTRSNQAILNFEEPWLFQRRLAAGFSLYRTETRYLSDVYDERRTGFEVYLRKRLVELVDGRLGYRLERVSLFDVDSAASAAIQAEEGGNTISKITFNLTRDTRDKVLFSTSGNRFELDTALASDSLGGNTNYWQVEGRGAQYYHSFTWPTPQYISFLGRLGTMDSFNGDTVPMLEKFYLGGPNTLRGFGYRKAGPKDNLGEPIGGKSYGFWSAEYTFQVAEPFQIAAFYDGGFVNRGAGDFSFANYEDDIGFGVRFMVMGAPLRLDYAIPLSSDTASGGRFWFSFGTRF